MKYSDLMTILRGPMRILSFFLGAVCYENDTKWANCYGNLVKYHKYFLLEGLNMKKWSQHMK